MNTIHRKILGLALLLATCSVAPAGVIFTVTGTSNATALGYVAGQSYSFTFTTGSSFGNSPSSSFSPSQNAWIENTTGDDQLWSAVGGTQVTGNFTRPNQFPTSPSSYIVANNGFGTRTLNVDAGREGLGGIGISTPSGDEISAVSFALQNVANFSFTGTYSEPTAYFADYYGTYFPTGTINLDTRNLAHAFTVASLTIGPSEASVSVSESPAPFMYSAIVGFCALAMTGWRRCSGPKSSS